jgi:hypothetical protein
MIQYLKKFSMASSSRSDTLWKKMEINGTMQSDDAIKHVSSSGQGVTRRLLYPRVQVNMGVGAIAVTNMPPPKTTLGV